MASDRVPMPEEFTVHCVSQHASRLIKLVRGGGEVRLDLSRVRRIDTAGVQLLLVLRREAARALMQLEFCDPSPAVSEVVTFYQLADLLSPLAAPPSA